MKILCIVILMKINGKQLTYLEEQVTVKVNIKTGTMYQIKIMHILSIGAILQNGK